MFSSQAAGYAHEQHDFVPTAMLWVISDLGFDMGDYTIPSGQPGNIALDHHGYIGGGFSIALC